MLRARDLLFVLLPLLVLQAEVIGAQILITDLTDPPGDDHGPGTYTYPTDAAFVPGAFDLTRFRVWADGADVIFEIQIAGEITNPFSSPDGYSLQSIDIMIDTDGVSGSGSTTTLPGRFATVAPRDAWDRLLWIAPRFGDEFAPAVHFPDGSADTTGIRVSVDPGERLIRATVPSSLVGAPQAEWKYIVTMLGQDGFSTGRVRSVGYFSTAFGFGGGEGGTYDSNILDLINSGGMSQEGMLSRYASYLELRPVLFASDNGLPPAIVHTPVTFGEENRQVQILAELLDEPVASGWLRYQVNGGVIETLEFRRVDVDLFFAPIPGSAVKEGEVLYWILATDAVDTTSAPADTTLPFRVTVGPDVTPPDPLGWDVFPDVMTPNDDGVDDESMVGFFYPEIVTLDLNVIDSQENVVTVLATQAAVNEYEAAFWTWDGRNQLGEIVATGNYRFRAIATDSAGRTAVTDAPVQVFSSVGADRELEVVLFFHLNQALVPYARVGNAASYRGLLEILLANPDAHFPLHVSGTLIHALQWFDPGTMDLLRQGIAAGQFEVVGSTYAQNIMYSTRDETGDLQQNQNQIRLHRDLIESSLGVSPVTFWNAERVWTQSFTGLLRNNGYNIAQIEDYLLARAGATGSEYRVRTTSHEGDTLVVFNDDKEILRRVDAAVDTGDPAPVLSLLSQIWGEDVDDQFAVGYFQDAEATGLWDFESGLDPEANFQNLGAMIAAIEADPRFRLVTFSEWLETHEPSEHLDVIPDGAADWMGRDAWFAENERAEADQIRALFDSVRDSANAVRELFPGASVDTAAAASLLDHAWLTLAGYQYEFAVQGFAGFTGTYEMSRRALPAVRAARHALAPDTGVYQEDLNDDGVTELVVLGPEDMVVVTPHGGRLLYWFDLVNGIELVGNERFFHYLEPWTTDSVWHPPLNGAADVYPWLSGNPHLPEIATWSFELRRRALADFLSIDGADRGDLRNLPYDVDAVLSDGVELSVDLGEAVLKKSVRLTAPGRIQVAYTVEGTSAPVALRVESALCPDLNAVMDGGRETLAFWDGTPVPDFAEEVRGVVNTTSGDRVMLVPGTGWSGLEGREVVFGLLLAPTLTGSDPSGVSVPLSFDLLRGGSVTPVRLLRFEAVTRPEGVTVVWETADQSAHAGFHVWRSSFREMKGERINPELIQGGPRHQVADTSAQPGDTYFYRLEAVSRNGSSEFFGPVEVSVPLLPTAPFVSSPRPNPFVVSTTATLLLPPSTPGARAYELSIFDAGGRRVRVLDEGYLAAESRRHSVSWDGRDRMGRPVSGGIYFLTLRAGAWSRTQKLVLVR